MNGKVCSLCGAFDHTAPQCKWNKGQPKWQSWLEAVVNTVVGLVVAMLATAFICKAYDIPMSWGNNAIITFWMTVLSVLRSYLLRRFFNSRIVLARRYVK